MIMEQLTGVESEEVSVINDQTLPGAWPITPVHKRTRTYPLQPQERVAQLQHRMGPPLQRHQQAQRALPDISSSGEGLGSSSSSSGIPSDDSNLTRFTPSHSAFAVHSLTSSSSSIASSTANVGKHEISKPECSKPPIKSPQCIQPPPVPNNPHANDSSLHLLNQLTSHVDDSLSRIPTSHRLLKNTRGNLEDSYDYSSSWKSSGNEGNVDDSRLLRIGTPSPTPSPSPSSVSARNNCRQEVLTVPVTSPSVDELVLPLQAMTALSLPGILNDDSFSLNLPVPFEMQPYANQEGSDTPWTLSLAPNSETAAAPTSSISPSVCVSPYLRAYLENPASIHATRFPLPAHTSPQSPVDFLPSIPVTEETDSFSAADFAHAAVMSSWGNDAVAALGSNRTINGRVMEDIPQIQTEIPINTNRSRRSVTFAEECRHRGGILSRVKKLGNKVKTFLMGKPRPPHRYVLKRSITVQESLDVADITENQSSGSQILPRLESEFGGGSLAGALASRTRRHRPSLTSETYTPADHLVLETQDAAFPGATNMTSPNAMMTLSPRDELQHQLAEHARPKTVNEIKAKRPFSFSAFPNLAASSSNASNRKSRPVSDLVMTSSHASSSSGQGRTAVQHQGHVANHVVLPPRYSHVPPPPGLTNLTSSGACDSTSLPSGHHCSTSGAAQTVEYTRPTDTRRFSLSALSTFAAGLKHQGTWARYS